MKNNNKVTKNTAPFKEYPAVLEVYRDAEDGILSFPVLKDKARVSIESYNRDIISYNLITNSNSNGMELLFKSKSSSILPGQYHELLKGFYVADDNFVAYTFASINLDCVNMIRTYNKLHELIDTVTFYHSDTTLGIATFNETTSNGYIQTLKSLAKSYQQMLASLESYIKTEYAREYINSSILHTFDEFYKPFQLKFINKKTN